MTADTARMNGRELLDAYNTLRRQSGQPEVKKFRTLAEGRSRLERALAQVVAPISAPPRSKNSGISDEDEIVVLEPGYADKGRKTACKRRFDSLVVRRGLRNVGDIVSGGSSKAEVKWWIDKKVIRLK